MKTFLISVRVFAIITLLFVPAFAVMLLIALFVGQARWFGLVGVPALLLNVVIIVAKPSRDWVWRWVNSVAGTDPRIRR